MFKFKSLPTMARKYKGAPMSCLWVFRATRRRLTQSYLEAMTGYSENAIRSALLFLKEDGLVDHQSSGWALVEPYSESLGHGLSN